MSAPAAVLRRETRPAASRPTPQLRVVAAPKRRHGQLIYLSVLTLTLVGALMAVLALNTQLADGAFELHRMERQLEDAKARQVTLEESLVSKTAPAQVAAMAQELGMVAPVTTQYIILKDSAVVGAAPKEEPKGQDNAGADQ